MATQPGGEGAGSGWPVWVYGADSPRNPAHVAEMAAHFQIPAPLVPAAGVMRGLLWMEKSSYTPPTQCVHRLQGQCSSGLQAAAGALRRSYHTQVILALAAARQAGTRGAAHLRGKGAALGHLEARGERRAAVRPTRGASAPVVRPGRERLEGQGLLNPFVLQRLRKPFSRVLIQECSPF